MDPSIMAWKDKRKVMHRYDVTAEIYDERYAEEQKRKYKKALENSDLSAISVLDAGCGSGLFLGQIKVKTKTLVGIDISHKALLKAKEQIRNTENSYIIQADIDNLPFKQNTFEKVFGFTVLHNLPKPVKTLNELKRVATVDGKVVVTGLKKAFQLDKFLDILETSGFEVTGFVDDESLNCYVATLTAKHLHINYLSSVSV